MRTARAALLTGFGAAVVTLVAACASAPPANPASTVDTPMVAAGSAAKTYVSARDLAQDASAMVVGEVRSSEQVDIQGLTFTKHVFAVTSRLGGTAPDVIDVYQVGAPGWVIEDDVQAPGYLDVGATYALFVCPTELPQGTVGSDGYFIVGPGAWTDNGSSQFTLWRQPRARSSTYQVPTRFRLDDVASTMGLDTLGTRLK